MNDLPAYTAPEIAEMKLPGLPGTARGIRLLAKREGWSLIVRKQPSPGNGRPNHVFLIEDVLRTAQKIAVERYIKTNPALELEVGPTNQEAFEHVIDWLNGYGANEVTPSIAAAQLRDAAEIIRRSIEPKVECQ